MTYEPSDAVQQEKLISSYILDHHSRMKWIFIYFFGQCLGLDGPYLALSWPGLRFNSLDPRESDLDPVSTNFRLFFFRDLDKIVFGLSTPLICLGWPGNHHKKIGLEILHISGLWRRVKQSSWSNFMAMSIRFILQWRSRL